MTSLTRLAQFVNGSSLSKRCAFHQVRDFRLVAGERRRVEVTAWFEVAYGLGLISASVVAPFRTSDGWDDIVKESFAVQFDTASYRGAEVQRAAIRLFDEYVAGQGPIAEEADS